MLPVYHLTHWGYTGNGSDTEVHATSLMAITAPRVETAAATIGFRQADKMKIPAIQPRTGISTTEITIASSVKTSQDVTWHYRTQAAKVAASVAMSPAPKAHSHGLQSFLRIQPVRPTSTFNPLT